MSGRGPGGYKRGRSGGAPWGAGLRGSLGRAESMVGGYFSGSKRTRTTRRGNWRKDEGRKSIKAIKKTKVGYQAIQAALALKTLKQHEVVNPPTAEWSSNPSAAAAAGHTLYRVASFHPLDLDKSPTANETQRECNNIYAFNARGEIELLCHNRYINAFTVRVVKGWSKGNPDQNSQLGCTPLEGSQNAKLNGLLDTPEKTLDPDHYKVLEDKEYFQCPKQIFSASEHITAVAGVQTMTPTYQCNWTPFRYRWNMTFNKKVMYDGDSGGDLVGWVPFVAVVIYHQEGANPFLGAKGEHHQNDHNSSPTIKSIKKVFFKDC